MKKNKKIKIIGFSATPILKKPLNKIITKYNIYDAYLDNVILPPKIMWMKWDNKPEEKEILINIKRDR